MNAARHLLGLTLTCLWLMRSVGFGSARILVHFFV
jgi:hypothetical protein